MCGGLGTRLLPLTKKIPKPLLKINDKPLIELILDKICQLNIDEIFLAVSYKSELIINHFDNPKIKSRYPKIQYLTESKPMGTGGFLKIMIANNHLPTNSFLVVNGDNLFDINLHDFRKFHTNHKKINNAIVSIAVTKVENPGLFGTVTLENQRITSFSEKSSSPRSNVINSGYYFFHPQIIKYLPIKNFTMLETDIFPDVAHDKSLYGYYSDAYWTDVGNADSLKNLNIRLNQSNQF